jgi:putative peptidoglycan lipid II flippase
VARDEAQERSALQTSSLAVAALIVAAGFLGSRALGLLRSVIIAHNFGTSPELDAYWVAFRLPDLVFQLLAGATLASAFIPTFVQLRARSGDEAAWRLASSILNLVLIATAVFAAAAFVLAPTVLPLLAPGLGEESGREEEMQALAVELTRIMLLSPLLFAVSGMFMGILNARRHFLTPALAPMFYNLSIIGAALVSDDVRVLAGGVVVGAALHLVVQLPDLRFAGMAYRLVADWRDRAVREVGALMAPRVIGLAATQVNFYFIAIFFASTLSDGSISALSFAWLVLMTPLGVVGMAISTAAFPTLAEQAVRDTGALARTLSSTLRLILYLSLPAGVGLILLAKPLVVVLLQHGAFDAASSNLTTQALRFYAIALFAHAGIEILSRGFYALGDTRTPVAIAVVSMLLNLVLSLALVGPLELRGLALALSLATAAECLVLFAALGARVPALPSAELFNGLGRMAIATGVMAAAVLGLLALLDAAGLDFGRWRDAAIVLVCGGATGGLVYFALTFVLGSEEARFILRRLTGPLARLRRLERQAR